VDDAFNFVFRHWRQVVFPCEPVDIAYAGSVFVGGRDRPIGTEEPLARDSPFPNR